jgi:glycosidase
MNRSLYQINTKPYLTAIAGRGATLDDIPDKLLNFLASQGFELFWPLGVWSTGPTGKKISRSNTQWLSECLEVLPDLREDDICGSPFAISSYVVDPTLGGDPALARLRERLHTRGLKLITDFVPNHIGFDHPWVLEHHDFIISAIESTNINSDEKDSWIKLPDGRTVAFGRDPNYPGWIDTVQLNLFNPGLRDALTAELASIAERCDGVRCDMAMLIEPDVFKATWGERAAHLVSDFESPWPKMIRAARERHPGFLFIGEVYWGFDSRLQNHGFDYTYDKTLYDLILAHKAPQIREHLGRPIAYQQRCLRFLENHDEARIASKLNHREHLAAALITHLAPGLHLIFDGELEGRRLRVPVHINRAPNEKLQPEVERIYRDLIPLLNSPTIRFGRWILLNTREAWHDNFTHKNYIAFLIEHPLQTLLVSVNYAPYRGQSFITIPDRDWLAGKIEFRDLVSPERLVRDSEDLKERGLFLDCDAWGVHVFVLY